MKVYFAEPKTGIIVKDGVTIQIDMIMPHHVSIFYNPVSIKYTLEYRAKELTSKDKKYNEVVNKCKELTELMKIE